MNTQHPHARSIQMRLDAQAKAANERLAAEDRRLADLSALTPELRSKVLAKLAEEEPQRIARAVRYVLAFEATLAAIRPGNPRPNVLPSGAWCAYAEDHGTDRWHEHDHMACQDVQADAAAQATFDEVAADNAPQLDDDDFGPGENDDHGSRMTP